MEYRVLQSDSTKHEITSFVILCFKVLEVGNELSYLLVQRFWYHGVFRCVVASVLILILFIILTNYTVLGIILLNTPIFSLNLTICREFFWLILSFWFWRTNPLTYSTELLAHTYRTHRINVLVGACFSFLLQIKVHLSWVSLLSESSFVRFIRVILCTTFWVSEVSLTHELLELCGVLLIRGHHQKICRVAWCLGIHRRVLGSKSTVC